MGWPQVPSFPVQTTQYSYGGNFPNPKHFLPVAILASVVFTQSTASAPAPTRSTSSTFFTNIGNDGVNVDTDFTAAVAKQIVSISGDGEINYAIGPTASTAGEITTFTLVLDGSSYAIPVTLASGQRAALFSPANLGQAVYTTVGIYGVPIGTIDSTKTQYTATSDTVIVPLSGAVAVGIGRCEFRTSAVVSITHSVSITATAAMQRQCGLSYREYIA